MTPIQPTQLWSYLWFKTTKIPSSLDHFFYVSWEDALWDLLQQMEVPADSTALVPSFFCPDVVTNMAAHGVTSIYYPVDANFQTDPVVFKRWLEKYQPKVVVILHAVGITNKLWQECDIWLPALPKDCLLVEDSVHRVVNPQGIKLLTPNHVVIDSLRKVIPLPGSNLYTVVNRFRSRQHQHDAWYRTMVLWWWVIFQSCLGVSQLVPNRGWQRSWNLRAEQAMLIGYDLIGDSQQSNLGWKWAQVLAAHINFEKIKRTKQAQVAVYYSLLAEKHFDSFSVPVIPKSDWELLRGFPLILPVKKMGPSKAAKIIRTAEETLQILRAHGLMIRFELTDCPWSKDQKVVYLPIGPHLSLRKVTAIAHTIVGLIA